ncbi:MAG: RNA polymerase sigma factor [Candidatus Aminicenantales bacterium]
MAKEKAAERPIFFCRMQVRMREDAKLSEKEILELVKRGNKEAYGMIVKKYMKSAYCIALGFVHNRQDALDLSQEAFIKAFRRIKRFETDRAFFPWFYKLMKNLCLDYLRKKRRRREVSLEGIEVSERETHSREVQKVLWKAISELPFEQREVIILRYFQQLSYREMAEITGRPVGTVMSSLYYAKKKLKDIVALTLGIDQEGSKVN